MNVALKRPGRMTVAEFLAWDAPAGARWQLVDGEPQAMAPTSPTHGRLQSEVTRVIGNHLASRDGRCTLVTAPGIVPRVQAGMNFRIPDLAVSCGADEGKFVTDAVLIVEFLSPSNWRETWANVWTYTTIPNVQEILVLDTEAIAADLLRRAPDGTWPEEPERIEAGELTLCSIGFTAPLASLYRTTRLARG